MPPRLLCRSSRAPNAPKHGKRKRDRVDARCARQGRARNVGLGGCIVRKPAHGSVAFQRWERQRLRVSTTSIAAVTRCTVSCSVSVSDSTSRPLRLSPFHWYTGRRSTAAECDAIFVQGARNTWLLLVVVRRPERRPSVRTTCTVSGPERRSRRRRLSIRWERRGSGRDRRRRNRKLALPFMIT